jgi:alanyl-tRNA synthetase
VRQYAGGYQEREGGVYTSVMTERLYYHDAYLTSFDAGLAARADGGRRIYLDRTAFYPTSGGQPFDTGRLDGIEVVDVVDEGDRVAHLLAAPLPDSAGPRLAGEVNWPRRYDHMQQHTGQHLLSAVLADRFGLDTVSVHFGRDSSTLDLDAGSFGHAEMVEAEALANARVTENRPVRVSFEDATTAAGLRKTSERTGELRIVTIDGLDRSACGGTHVRATGEIGMITLRKVERVKQLVRVEFLCGARAVRRARADADLLTTLAAAHSAAPDDLPALFESQRAELKAATSARRGLEEELAGYRARELHAAAVPDARGLRLAVVRADDTTDRLRALAQAYATLPRGVLVGVLAEPPTIVVAAAADSGKDAGTILKTALERIGGRGGGNPRIAQGKLPDAGAADAALAAVRAALEAEPA